jgi:hypothetical protein
VIHLGQLTPAAEEGWWTLFDLARVDTENWLLIGGQMMHVLAGEHGVSDLVRPTDDVDIVMNVRAKPGGTEWLAGWLQEQGFVLDGMSTGQIGHRFVRDAVGGPGRTIVDVLAPECLGVRTDTYTVRPARTVEVPGSVQAFRRYAVVQVTVSGMTGRDDRSGAVRRPSLLGALIAKAAATSIPGRGNPGRDWQDAALLLATIPDPISAADECDAKDRRRLRLLRGLESREHGGWASLDDEAHRRGVACLSFLLGE